MAELRLENVSFSYGKHRVLEDISFSLTNGVVALLGPNGAGKTTLINMIMALYEPDTGNIYYNGIDISGMKGKFYDYVGYLPQMPQFYKNFTACKFLEYIGSLKGMKKKNIKCKIDELLKLVNLYDEKSKKIGTFSGGMRQRLGIAQALLNDPEILILDEPTAGLDPSERIRFRNTISKISASKIVILATHIVSDVESIASKAIFLKDNRAILFNDLAELTGKMEAKVWKAVVKSEAEAVQCASGYIVSNIHMMSDGNYELKVISESKPSESFIMAVPTLEDAFLYYYCDKTRGVCE